jgi:hypothetical protein
LRTPLFVRRQVFESSLQGKPSMESERSDERHHRTYSSLYQAIREVAVTAIFALTPIWAGAGLSVLLQETHSFRLAFYANTAKGDLFLLATAAIAPLVLYIPVRRGTLPKPLTIHFPLGWLFITLLMILFGGITLLFSIKRASELAEAKIDQDLFLQLSMISYGAALVLAFVVTAIKYSLDDIRPEELFRTDTRNFIESWRRRTRE